MNQKEIRKFVLDNLDRHKQFALGTVDETGKPWAVCLNLAYDDKFNIIDDTHVKKAVDLPALRRQ